MSTGPKVSILLHQHAAWDDTRHPFLWSLVKIWEESGIEVEILKGIPQREVVTDLLIVHVDMTVTPPEYLEFIRHFPNVVNRRITDISKRNISDNLVSPGHDYTGQVIVKTNLNYGGLQELIADDLAGKRTFYADTIQRPWRKVDYLDPDKYPIFESIRDVPPGVWRNPNLIVEKFIPEREGDYYCNRVALIMGEKVVCGRAFSLSPIVKGAGIVRSDPIETPAEFKQIRERYAIDYGKIDYVEHDGMIKVFDVNKTPGGLRDQEINMRLASKLADGLLPFLDTPQQIKSDT